MGRVGIMADSHGRPGVIRGGIDCLLGAGAGMLVHLGDVVDSARPETADACVALLREHGVLAVKGNNDHTIVASHLERVDGPVARSTAEWLKALPVKMVWENALFAHSLPFDEMLGLSATVRALGKAEARAILSDNPSDVFFRGHSHEPRLMWLEKGSYHERPVAPGEAEDLSPFFPCIVTCGALTRGYCLLWDPETGRLQSLRIRS